MIDFNAFCDYLNNVCSQYAKTGMLDGIGRKGRVYGCTSITKSQFFEFGLHKCSVVPFERAVEIRTLVSKAAKERRYIDSSTVSDVSLSLPDGMEIVKLDMPSFPEWGYALRCSSVIDSAGGYMYARRLNNAFAKELEESLHGRIDETYAHSFTTICSDGDLSVGMIYLVKMQNDGTCYWVHKCKEFLIYSALAAKSLADYSRTK